MASANQVLLVEDLNSRITLVLECERSFYLFYFRLYLNCIAFYGIINVTAVVPEFRVSLTVVWCICHFHCEHALEQYSKLISVYMH